MSDVDTTDKSDKEETLSLNSGTVNILDSDVKKKQDEACKIVMRDKEVLAAIMKAVCPEYKDIEEKEIAEKWIEPDSFKTDLRVSRGLTNTKLKNGIVGSTQENSVSGENKVTFDITFMAKAPMPEEKIKYKRKNKELTINLRIDIEPQGQDNPGYPIPKRAAFYCARLLSAEQNGAAEDIDYGDLYKVYSIWICFNCSDYKEDTIMRYKITRENLVGEFEESERDYNLMEFVIIRLSDDTKMTESRIINLLKTIFCENNKVAVNKNLKDLGFDEMSSVMKEVNRMKTIGDVTMEKGRAEGINLGLAKGIDLGRVEGINLCKRILKLRREGATIFEIAEATGVEPDKIRELLGEE